MAENYSCVRVCVCVCKHHIFFNHSPISGHLGIFNILAIINNAAINIRVRYLFEIVILFPLDTNPDVGLLDHFSIHIDEASTAGSYGSSIFLKDFYTVFHMLYLP